MLRPLSVAVKQSLEEATVLYEANRNGDLPPYLASRAMHPSTVERFRLGVVGTSSDTIHPGHEQYAGRLAIPYLGPSGVQGIRFRCLTCEDCSADDGCGVKFLGLSSVPTRLYNTRAIHEADDRIVILEGEGDTWTAAQLGLPAVGVPGSNNWKPHHWRIFTGFSDVIVVGDNDDAGRRFVAKVHKSIPVARPVIIGGKDKDDVTSLFVREGADAVFDVLGVKNGVRTDGP